MKSVFKEIIIILLLLLIIILLLGILFYDYMPNSKTVPTKVKEYALEEVVQQELDKELSDVDSEEIIKTYQLDTVDIEHYERTNEYNKGKINPFSEYSDGTENNTNQNNNNSNTENTSKEENPSKDNFLNTPGK